MKQALVLACVLLFVLGVGAWADTIVPGGGTTGLQVFPANYGTGTNGLMNNPYFAHSSVDADAGVNGNKKNIGYYLTGTGSQNFFSKDDAAMVAVPPLSISPSNLSYYGNSDGSAADSILFSRDTTSYVMTMLMSYTSLQLSFGWYDPSNPGVQHTLFSNFGGGAAAPGAQINFDPTSSQYGFFLEENGQFFYSNDLATGSGINLPEPQIGTKQHFTVFKSGSSFFIGAEDSIGWGVVEGVGDYQDFVVQIDVIPEPATFALFGLGLLGLGCARAWKRRKS